MAALLAERRPVAPEFVDGLLAAFKAGPAGGSRRASPTSTAANRALVEPLGDTQLVILRLVAEGLCNQEIADSSASPSAPPSGTSTRSTASSAWPAARRRWPTRGGEAALNGFRSAALRASRVSPSQALRAD